MTNKQEEGVSLQDIAVVVQIIDACSERGAFKGNELVTIGGIREKFDAIVQANTPEKGVDPAPEAEVLPDA